jgi:rhodanese-related sulfurtransferase
MIPSSDFIGYNNIFCFILKIMYIFKYLKLILLIFLLTACNNEASSYTNISNAELKKLMADGAVLVDVRTAQEWKQTGIIAGSKTVSLFFANGKMNSDFVPELQKIVKPNDAVILICRTGGRSGVASELLFNKLGYKNVYNVQNGIMKWIRQGNPVVAVNL